MTSASFRYSLTTPSGDQLKAYPSRPVGFCGSAPTRSRRERQWSNPATSDEPTMPTKPGASPHCGAMRPCEVALISMIAFVVGTSSVRSK